jgi:pSer/pThr/pTyr-binding forkhead associated (FHA) protein
VGKLVLFLADGTTLDIPLDRERTTIGRRPGTDVCLPYAAVSGEHAVIVTSARGSTIEDLGSTNGTLVNGESIARHKLADGDRIDIGRQKLVYLTDPASTVPNAPKRRAAVNRIESARAAASAAGRTELFVAAPRATALPPLTGGAPAEVAMRRIGATPVVAPTQPSAGVLTVVAGPSAGRTLHLTKAEALVGRVGAQVAVIRQVDGAYRLYPGEGAHPPRLNGPAVSSEGAPLATGDEVEVASTRLRFTASATG